jgi:hypothetical protein
MSAKEQAARRAAERSRFGISFAEKLYNQIMQETTGGKSMHIHEIKIKKVNRGFIVEVGCQTFVFENEKKMFDAMVEYWKEPAAAEAKYCDLPSSGVSWAATPPSEI